MDSLYGWSACTTGISGWVRCIPYISKPQLIRDKGGMLRHAPALPHATIKPREIRPCGRRTAAYNYVVSGRRIFSNENGFSDCMPTGDVCDPSGGGEGNSAGSWFNVSLSFIFSIAGVTWEDDGGSSDSQICVDITVPSFFVLYIVLGVTTCAESTSPTIIGPVALLRFVFLWLDMGVKMK
jgi:hypothetical protein